MLFRKSFPASVSWSIFLYFCSNSLIVPSVLLSLCSIWSQILYTERGKDPVWLFWMNPSFPSMFVFSSMFIFGIFVKGNVAVTTWSCVLLCSILLIQVSVSVSVSCFACGGSPVQFETRYSDNVCSLFLDLLVFNWRLAKKKKSESNTTISLGKWAWFIYCGQLLLSFYKITKHMHRNTLNRGLWMKTRHLT